MVVLFLVLQLFVSSHLIAQFQSSSQSYRLTDAPFCFLWGSDCVNTTVNLYVTPALIPAAKYSTGPSDDGGATITDSETPKLSAKESFENSSPSYAGHLNTTKSLALIRAIGNALPPRHDSGQTLRNLAFVLENEPRFPNTHRHWFLNRLVDDSVEKEVIALLKHYNESYTIVGFDLATYDQIPYQHDRGVEPSSLLYQSTAEHDKIVYVMNVNGVRNQMLEYGQEKLHVDYVLPWDGNCFVTVKAFVAIQEALQSNAQYYWVPMDRFRGYDNREIISANYTANPTEEPQIIFSSRAKARFNPQLRYGRRNKVELLARLGVSGPWDDWRNWMSWERRELANLDEPVTDIGPTGTLPAGWTTRLASGMREAEEASGLRNRLRHTAVSRFLERLDVRAAIELHYLRKKSLLYYNATLLLANKHRIVQAAEAVQPKSGSLQQELPLWALAYNVTGNQTYLAMAHKLFKKMDQVSDFPVYFVDALKLLPVVPQQLESWMREYFDSSGDLAMVPTAIYLEELEWAVRVSHLHDCPIGFCFLNDDNAPLEFLRLKHSTLKF